MSAGQITQGRRVYTESVSEYQPGDYGKKGDWWYVCIPTADDWMMGLIDVSKWNITEHEDKTITISPSILIGPAKYKKDGVEKTFYWHGFLERGVWREV